MQFGAFDSDQDFLTFFRKMNCELEYLVTEAISRKDMATREKQRSKGIQSLSQRLKRHRPKYIIVIMKDIEKYVLLAVEKAKLLEDTFIKSVPFPAMSEKNRINCEIETAKILKDYVGL